MSPLPSGSYLVQAFSKAIKHSWLTRTFDSVAEAANPSRIIAIKRLRKTRLTIRINEMKYTYADLVPHP